MYLFYHLYKLDMNLMLVKSQRLFIDYAVIYIYSSGLVVMGFLPNMMFFGEVFTVVASGARHAERRDESPWPQYVF